MIPIPIIATIIVVLYILSAIKIFVGIRAWRDLPPRAATAAGQRAGNHSGVCARGPHGADFAAPGSFGSSSAGHHHPGQRHSEGKRSYLSARH